MSAVSSCYPPPLQRKRGASFIQHYQNTAARRATLSEAADSAPAAKRLTNTSNGSPVPPQSISGVTGEGESRHLLPPQDSSVAGRLTVVLDLDETLVYARAGPLYVRPGLEHLLSFLREHCETIVWTAGANHYADAVVSEIDKHRVVRHTIARDPKWVTDGSKNVKLLNRDLDRLILIDNTPDAIRGNEFNSVLVEDYEGGELEDPTLYSLVELLQDIESGLKMGRTVPEIIKTSRRIIHRSLPTDAGEMMRCPCLV